MTTDFKIYSREDCIWCDRAKNLMIDYGYTYDELIYGVDYNKDDLREIVGPDVKLTTPQILQDGKLIGGFTELEKMLRETK